MDVDECKFSDLAPLNHQVQQLLNLHAVNLAVNYLQFAQLMRDVFHEKRLHALD